MQLGHSTSISLCLG